MGHHREAVNPILAGGGGGIRTHETLSGLTVFKTAGVNRFPTPPISVAGSILTYGAFVDNERATMSAARCGADFHALLLGRLSRCGGSRANPRSRLQQE